MPPIDRSYTPLVLVGLPGSGKTTAGRIAADLLGAPFTDLDELIEARTGKPVAQIFAESGEPHFRALESEVTRALAAGPLGIVAPGGGWIENPANPPLLCPPAKTVWLRVSVDTAFARTRGAEGLRPLLAGPDPWGKLGEISRRRTPLYQRAEAVVDAEILSPQQVAENLVGLALRWGTSVG